MLIFMTILILRRAVLQGRVIKLEAFLTMTSSQATPSR